MKTTMISRQISNPMTLEDAVAGKNPVYEYATFDSIESWEDLEEHWREFVRACGHKVVWSNLLKPEYGDRRTFAWQKSFDGMVIVADFSIVNVEETE